MQVTSGSLVVQHQAALNGHAAGLTFRHSFYIKKNGEYHQWGKTGDECWPHDNTLGRVYGPDVGADQAGIFGLAHEELIGSEWCANDTLTVKCKLAVRTALFYSDEPAKLVVELPAPTIAKDWLAILDSGTGDVIFEVEGEEMAAHSLVLSARSEVFATQLSSGMRESTDKRITISEFGKDVFRLMLKFLYSDDLACLDVAIEGDKPALEMLQSVLAISHKYQLQRLLSWSENKLCELLDVQSVCGVVVQAHVYEASVLEVACLELICYNLESVMVSREYGFLSRDWPAVALKIQLHKLNVSKDKAALAFKAQEEASMVGTKRQRTD